MKKDETTSSDPHTSDLLGAKTIEDEPNCPVHTPVILDPLTHNVRHLSGTEARAAVIASQHRSLEDDLGAKLVAGGLSNMALSLILNPMDVIKVSDPSVTFLKTRSMSSIWHQKF